MANPVKVVDIDFYNNSTHSHTYEVLDYNKEPVPLTGFTALMEIREEAGSAVIYTASDALGSIIINEAEGTVDLLIPGEDVGDFVFTGNQAEYDLFVISPAGNPYAVARGKCRKHPSITDPFP
jgi:hypothetical protein